MALADNIVFCLEMNEASGDASDASGGGNTFTDTGTCGSAAGVIGNCRTLNGTTQYFTRADSAALSREGKDWSIVAWVQTTDAAVGTVCGKYTGFGNFEFYLIEAFSGTGNRFHLRVTDNAASADLVYADNFGAIPTNTWLMVFAYCKASTGEIGISVNNGTPNTTAGTANRIQAGTSPFQIGAYNSSNFHSGKIDQISLWDRVLSGAEVTQLYNGGAGLAFSSWAAAFMARKPLLLSVSRPGRRTSPRPITINRALAIGGPPRPAFVKVPRPRTMAFHRVVHPITINTRIAFGASPKPAAVLELRPQPPQYRRVVRPITINRMIAFTAIPQPPSGKIVTVPRPRTAAFHRVVHPITINTRIAFGASPKPSAALTLRAQPSQFRRLVRPVTINRMIAFASAPQPPIGKIITVSNPRQPQRGRPDGAVTVNRLTAPPPSVAKLVLCPRPRTGAFHRLVRTITIETIRIGAAPAPRAVIVRRKTSRAANLDGITINRFRGAAGVGPGTLKSWNGVLKAQIKTINGVPLASVKSVNGLT